MRMRQYKHSGIPWMKQIPENWSVVRGKDFLYLMSRPVREDDDVVTCFRDGEVVLRSERRTEGFTMSDKEIGYQGINKGDIVIHGMDGFAGAMGVSKSTGKGSPVLIVCNPKSDDDARFVIYYLRSLAMNNVFVALATGIRERSCDLRWNKISVLPFVRPPFTEQKKIADFIDMKSAEIDSLIALQEQMIEKLKAYRQSVITEAVTKGLDPNAKLVPSGIDWIGEIPEGWEVNKLFNLCTIKGRVGWKGLRSDEFKENSYAYLVTGQDFVSSDINWNNCYQIDKERYDEDPYIQLTNGDILVTKDGSIGKIAKVSGMDKPACLNSGIFVLKQRKDTFFQDYLYWYLASPLLLRYNTFINTGGTTIIHLYQNVFERFSMIVPPYHIQQEIAIYLDEKCADIDCLIALKQQKIEKLKDYKKSVIYEAVTGKTTIE